MENNPPTQQGPLGIRLGDIRLDPAITVPLGGLNPYSPHFQAIGAQFLQHFITHGGLLPQHRVLEIGCGTGRIAAALRNFLTKGSYTGCDVNPYFLEYCRQQDYPAHFSFDHFDVQHDEYNLLGNLDGALFRFPYPDASFHFIGVVALFNHLRLPTVIQYIAEAARLLVQGGVFFSTCILLNEFSMRTIEQKVRPPFKFEHHEADSWHEYADRPLFNVALPEAPIRRQFLRHQLMLKPIRYGEWCQSSNAITGHDIIIARKGDLETPSLLRR